MACGNIFLIKATKAAKTMAMEYLMKNLLLLQIATEGKSIAFSWLKTLDQKEPKELQGAPKNAS